MKKSVVPLISDQWTMNFSIDNRGCAQFCLLIEIVSAVSTGTFGEEDIKYTY